MGRRGVGGLVALVALGATLALVAPAAGGDRQVPLASPAPGGPVFSSFTNTFDDALSSTLFETKAQGSDLAYVWTLQPLTCGTIAQPDARDFRNAYVHPSCAAAVEYPVRVQVLVAKASDLTPQGVPKNDQVAYFVYSQVARAADAADTASLPKNPQLQYFGPGPIPTTTSRAGTAVPGSTSGPGGGDGPPIAAVAVAGAIIGAGVITYAAVAMRPRKGSQTVKYECSLHCDLDPSHEGGMGHATANLKKTTTTLDPDGKVISTVEEETVYDFAPKGNAGLFAVVIGGTAGKVLRYAGKGTDATNWYQTITQEGYDKGKTWADAQVTSPPDYRASTYNCCDFARQVCTEAGGSPPSGGTFVSTPADLLDHIKTSAEGLTAPKPPVGELPVGQK